MRVGGRAQCRLWTNPSLFFHLFYLFAPNGIELTFLGWESAFLTTGKNISSKNNWPGWNWTLNLSIHQTSEQTIQRHQRNQKPSVVEARLKSPSKLLLLGCYDRTSLFCWSMRKKSFTVLEKTNETNFLAGSEKNQSYPGAAKCSKSWSDPWCSSFFLFQTCLFG